MRREPKVDPSRRGWRRLRQPARLGSVGIRGDLGAFFSVDFGSYASTGPTDFESPQVDVFFSSMTIQNGKNPNNFTNTSATVCHANNSCNPYGGSLYWEAEPSSNLVLTNVTLSGGTTAVAGAEDIGGGAIAAGFDFSNSGTAGPLDIENSIITSNSDVSAMAAAASPSSMRCLCC